MIIPELILDLLVKAKPLGSLYNHALLNLTKSSKVQQESRRTALHRGVVADDVGHPQAVSSLKSHPILLQTTLWTTYVIRNIVCHVILSNISPAS